MDKSKVLTKIYMPL